MTSLKCLIIFMLSIQTWALGPSTGGGGDVVILPDDSVILADPFLNSGAPQPNNMPPLRSLNPRLLQVADSYLKAVSFHLKLMTPKSSDQNTFNSDIANEMEKLATRKNKLRFYAVQNQTELSMFCAPGGRKSYVLPSGARVEQVACTAGDETFLVEPLFLRMSLKDQTLLLVHERLTTLRDSMGGKNYSAIARFTTGMGLYLSLYREQYKNNYRSLNPAEQRTLTEFYIAIEEIERRNSEITEDSFQWLAATNGGGRIHSLAQIADDVVVALNVVLGKKSVIGRGVSLKNIHYTDFQLPEIEMDDYTSLDGVTFSKLKILKMSTKSSIQNSTVSGYIQLANSSEIKGSELYNNIQVGQNSRVLKSIINLPRDLKIQDEGLIENSNISVSWIPSHDDGVIVKNVSNGFVDDLSVAHYPPGYKVKNIDVSWTEKLNHKLKIANLKRDAADNWAEFFKKSFYVNDDVFTAYATSSFTYKTDGIFSDDYMFSFKETRFKIKLDASKVKVERRPNAYTVHQGQIVLAHLGQHRTNVILKFNDSIDLFRFDILRSKLEELGFVKIDRYAHIYSAPVEAP